LFFFLLRKILTKKTRIITAFTSCFIAGLILIFAVFGNTILGYFDVSIEGLKVGAGLLLMYIAFEMIFAGQLFYQRTSIKSFIVSPLAIPMLAGPGSMSFAMISFVNLSGFNRLNILLAILFASFFSGVVLSLSSFFHKILNNEIIRGIEKVTAVVVSFIAAEMIMSGIKSIFLLTKGDCEAIANRARKK